MKKLFNFIFIIIAIASSIPLFIHSQEYVQEINEYIDTGKDHVCATGCTEDYKDNNQDTSRYSSYEPVYCNDSSYCIDVQFRALILKPSSNNLHYAAQARPLPLTTPFWDIFDIKTKYHFGFEVGLLRFDPYNGTHFAANCTHYNSASSSAHQVPTGTDMIGPFFEIGPDASSYKIATGSAKFKFDSVHLTAGQCVQLVDCLNTNFFAGINITYLKQELTSLYSNNNATITRTILTPTTFLGAGPEFGVDFAYFITPEFNFAGRCSASILVGPSKNHTAYISTFQPIAGLNLPSPNVQRTSVNKRTLVVPTFEERLGLGYTLTFCNNCMFTIEAGYEARLYLGALQSVDMGSEVINIIPGASNVGVFARTFQRNISNFALTGPYASCSLAF